MPSLPSPPFMPFRQDRSWFVSGLADTDGDAKITRAEFSALCLEKIWYYPEPLITRAADNFAIAQRTFADAPNRYWQSVALGIDAKWRLFGPLFYTIFLALIYNVTVIDGYDEEVVTNSGERTGRLRDMFLGLAYYRSYFTASKLYIALFFPIGGLLACIVYSVRTRLRTPLPPSCRVRAPPQLTWWLDVMTAVPSVLVAGDAGTHAAQGGVEEAPGA